MTGPSYRRCPAVTWRRLPAQLVMAVPGRATPLQLNATGAALWDLLEEPIDGPAVTGRLAASFGRQPDEIAAAVAQLLEELVVAGAVEQR